jgi:hypothetical protein
MAKTKKNFSEDDILNCMLKRCDSARERTSGDESYLNDLEISGWFTRLESVGKAWCVATDI